MNLKKTTQIVLFFLLTTVTWAQEIYIETGKASTSFDYKDSEGSSLDNLYATTHSFLAMGYKTKVFNEKIIAGLGVAYSGYGATGSDNAIEHIMAWDANYLEFNLGLDYRLFNINKAAFYAKGAVATGVLLEGTQTLNDEIIDLKGVDDFKNPMISYKAGASVLYPVANDLSFYIQYMYGKSLNLSNSADGESLKIKSNNISFGVVIKLLK
ncbi:hypothetical protein [Mariniflexile sp.]|uniref:hypothetical protein n=1 Tax=Mariniflexile sp. TaxID=1979402 RepID=UPI0035650F37